MYLGKALKGRRKRVLPAGLALVLVAGALTIASVGSGASPVVGKGGAYGETYTAHASTIAKTLFAANLLPKNPNARNIALAAYHRAEMKVNLALALKCWKNNGCATGTGGKMTVAYVEGFGENVYRQMSKMEFILQALTYPQVGHIIYTSAHSNLNQALADFRAAIAKKVSVIVTYPDFGDAMLPVFKEAKQAGIPVATYAWGYVTGPGTNYTTVVGEDTCALGKAYAALLNKYVGSGNVAFLGGFPGNPLSLGWMNCERPALNKSINVIGPEWTNWDPSMVQSVVSGILAQHPDIKGWSYEYSLGMAQGAFAAYQAAGIPFNGVLTMRTDDAGLGCKADALHNPNLKIFYYTGGNSQIRLALTAGMMKLKGARIPPTIVFPIQMQDQSKRDMCTKGYPQEADATSLIPLSLLHQMYPGK